MAKYALYVSLKAKPGKEKDVEAFLKQGAEMAKKEAGTVNWYGLKEDEGSYSVFDTFNDEAGRDAHLNGEIAKALMAKASELFANPPQIHKIDYCCGQVVSQAIWCFALRLVRHGRREGDCRRGVFSCPRRCSLGP